MNARRIKASSPELAGEFATTHWSLVLAAGRNGSQSAADALAALCQAYWYPLYVYVRRKIGDVHQAQDLTQQFFTHLLEKNTVAVAAPERGRFRSFLLTALNNFLVNEWDKAKAQKRGGSDVTLSLEFDSGESRYRLEPHHELTPERLFERQWALTLLDRVLLQLQTEYANSGKLDQFEQLQVFIASGRAEVSYAQAAGELGVTAGAAKVAAHRLRRRYRELLRAELAQTVADEAELEDEISQLFAALG